MAARGDLVAVADPVVGPIRQQGSAVRYVGEDPGGREVPTGAPRLGEHTREVLTEVAGLDDAEVDALSASGVV
jgi:crotonobetainyl-CoA:carnitine CoA-transferase CaiB-like acyl-CoA transferase